MLRPQQACVKRQRNGATGNAGAEPLPSSMCSHCLVGPAHAAATCQHRAPKINHPTEMIRSATDLFVLKCPHHDGIARSHWLTTRRRAQARRIQALCLRAILQPRKYHPHQSQSEANTAAASMIDIYRSNDEYCPLDRLGSRESRRPGVTSAVHSPRLAQSPPHGTARKEIREEKPMIRPAPSEQPLTQSQLQRRPPQTG